MLVKIDFLWLLLIIQVVVALVALVFVDGCVGVIILPRLLLQLHVLIRATGAIAEHVMQLSLWILVVNSVRLQGRIVTGIKHFHCRLIVSAVIIVVDDRDVVRILRLIMDTVRDGNNLVIVGIVGLFLAMAPIHGHLVPLLNVVEGKLLLALLVVSQ